MMKLLLPLALFFVVEGKLRGDLAQDERRDLKKCKMGKPVSYCLLLLRC
jgi:hypothetical protein